MKNEIQKFMYCNSIKKSRVTLLLLFFLLSPQHTMSLALFRHARVGVRTTTTITTATLSLKRGMVTTNKSRKQSNSILMGWGDEHHLS